CVVCNHPPIGRHRSAQGRQHLCCQALAIRQWRVHQSSKQHWTTCAMFGDEFAHLVNGADAVEIALALGASPCEKTMAAEDQTFGARVVFHRLFDEERQLESRALPRHPGDAAAVSSIAFLEL